MTKSEFLMRLDSALAQLPAQERQRHIEYYTEMIDDMTEDGMEEVQAVSSLEPVQVIAERILQELSLPMLVGSRVRPKSGWGPLSITLAIVGAPLWLPLVIAFSAVILVVFIVIWILIAVAFIVTAAIGVSGVALVIGGLLLYAGQWLSTLFLVGAGIAACGLCILVFYGAKALGRGLAELTVWLFHKVKSMFIRKEVQI